MRTARRLGVNKNTIVYRVEKADPYAFAAETRPRTASKVWDLSGYEWGDREWMEALVLAALLSACSSLISSFAASGLPSLAALTARTKRGIAWA